MRFQPLERLINLYDGYAKTFKIDSLHLLLRQDAGQVLLIEAHCPHRGHSLASATLSGGVLECPLHAYQFSIASGDVIRCAEEPCRALKVYELIYEGTELGLLLED
jgi:nitrite reductase/ring-hydroxylating ferredoxin subunit